jgi:hypothetical protein
MAERKAREEAGERDGWVPGGYKWREWDHLKEERRRTEIETQRRASVADLYERAVMSTRSTFCVETFAGCPVAALDLPVLASHAAVDHSEMATLSRRQVLAMLSACGGLLGLGYALRTFR